MILSWKIKGNGYELKKRSLERNIEHEYIISSLFKIPNYLREN
jgi:hypothetical protein